jgi:uncharacterized protein (TIGR03790 family)
VIRLPAFFSARRCRWRALVRCGLAWLGAASFATAPAPAAEENLAARVLLLANRDEADSLRIARHYAEVRGVPPENIFALPMSRAETIAWPEFVATIWQPLLDELIRTKWIDALPMDLTDAVGRKKYAPHGHRIAALVVCRGVPLRIPHDPALYVDTPPLTRHAEYRTNAAAVDSELALLALPNCPINAFQLNPLFQRERPTATELEQVVKVARLDGPTFEDANALVDRAVAAERTGLLGRAYVDYGDYTADGNAWFADVERQLRAAGFDLGVHPEAGTFPATARCDAPVLYFGWYAGSLNGPFALPGFRFPPGAIALHLHSFSAATLRSPGSGWTGPLVARGVTATVGNVWEPYLQLTHHADMFVRALLRGWNLADAAYYSLVGLSWQQVLIGDPLYRPFAMPLDRQLAELEKLPAALAGYAALRGATQLDAAERRDDALRLLRATYRDRPNIALALALARRLHAAGDSTGAAQVLTGVPPISFSTDEWGLLRETALLAQACGAAPHAVELWRAVFASRDFPRELRLAWLPEAIRTAEAAENPRQAGAWRSELAALATPAAGAPTK